MTDKRLVAGGSALVLAAIAGTAIALQEPASAQTPPSRTCNGAGQPFCDSTVPLPAGWTGRKFRLAQAYPAAAPADKAPWTAFDPKTQPEAYLRAVLGYFFEGNIRPDVEASFDPALNTVRAWYNAPWQDSGVGGREPIHGLTRERVSLPGELANDQAKCWNNYAVGFYNAPGAVAIGRMWKDHAMPRPQEAADLPEGTVAAKLLFTTATPDDVPFLSGSPTWNVYVYKDVHATGYVRNPKPGETPSPRALTTVRLLQIDIAVRDSRVDSTTGWVFGTFIYGGGPGGTPGSGWTNVQPVGVMWGNDPGIFTGVGLKETWINPKVKMPHIGYQGRLNGPVDNPISSCLSCHGAAQDPLVGMIPPYKARGKTCSDNKSSFPMEVTDTGNWFDNVRSGKAMTPPGRSFGYSMQLAVGYANWAKSRLVKSSGVGASAKSEKDQRPPRDGGPVN